MNSEIIKIHYQSLTSTNTVTRETVLGSSHTSASGKTAAGGVLPLLITADEQTAGRGRYGRSFYSPEGSGIYMSYAYERDYTEAELLKVTTRAAELILPVLQAHTRKQLVIKPVNDIYVLSDADALSAAGVLCDSAASSSAIADLDAETLRSLGARKIAGILTERVDYPPTGTVSDTRASQYDGTSSERSPEYFIIIGIGINCESAPIPSDLTDTEGNALSDIIGFLEPDCSHDTLIDEITAALAGL